MNKIKSYLTILLVSLSLGCGGGNGNLLADGSSLNDLGASFEGMIPSHDKLFDITALKSAAASSLGGNPAALTNLQVIGTVALTLLEEIGEQLNVLRSYIEGVSLVIRWSDQYSRDFAVHTIPLSNYIQLVEDSKPYLLPFAFNTVGNDFPQWVSVSIEDKTGYTHDSVSVEVEIVDVLQDISQTTPGGSGTELTR